MYSMPQCTVSSVLLMQVDAGMDKELVFGDPKAPRFVWWEKKLRPTPSGPDALTFDLLSIVGKLRAGFGALGFKQAAPGWSPKIFHMSLGEHNKGQTNCNT